MQHAFERCSAGARTHEPRGQHGDMLIRQWIATQRSGGNTQGRFAQYQWKSFHLACNLSPTACWLDRNSMIHAVKWLVSVTTYLTYRCWRTSRSKNRRLREVDKICANPRWWMGGRKSGRDRGWVFRMRVTRDRMWKWTEVAKALTRFNKLNRYLSGTEAHNQFWMFVLESTDTTLHLPIRLTSYSPFWNPSRHP